MVTGVGGMWRRCMGKFDSQLKAKSGSSLNPETIRNGRRPMDLHARFQGNVIHSLKENGADFRDAYNAT